MDDVASLCRACGLCCDGSLFGRAQLDADEVESATKHRLRVVANGRSFEQRCSALGESGCAIYDDRPRTCRRFVCRLHERLRIEGGDLEPYLARVRRARELLVRVETSGLAEPELADLMDADFARALTQK